VRAAQKFEFQVQKNIAETKIKSDIAL